METFNISCSKKISSIMLNFTHLIDWLDPYKYYSRLSLYVGIFIFIKIYAAEVYHKDKKTYRIVKLQNPFNSSNWNSKGSIHDK
jgi:hypothetical protein